MKKRMLIVFGTRPEAIKMCPLVKEFRKRGKMEVKVCVSGQHREMLKQVLDLFDVVPDYDLKIMKPGQSLFDITSKALAGIRDVLVEYKPDLVFVHGDTTTAFASSLACFYLQIPVAHVEAGLRTYNIYSPFPEEFNRQAISLMAKYHFAPTKMVSENLIKEGKAQDSIYITGNTVIDALKTTVRNDYKSEITEWAKGNRLVLITAHRRENLGEPMNHMFHAIRKIADEYEDVRMLCPMHPNPKVREAAYRILGGSDRIRLIEPLNAFDFHNLMNHSYFILTDSGGIQEEAPALDKPVLVMRNTTERPEGLKAGTLMLVGTEEERIYSACKMLLDNIGEYQKMCQAPNPYGDGNASKRIVEIVERDFL
ncbi:non-hydrolyzing UDP-N-acetylglucosamine 2-epimerase [Hungatella hathewayi]